MPKGTDAKKTKKDETEETASSSSRWNFEMPKDVVAVKKVNAAGNITGLRDHVGKEFLVVRVPEAARSERFTDAVERPRSFFMELFEAAREHGELTQKQVEKFRKKYASDLSSDEVQKRLRETSEEVRKRLEDLGKEIETRYERIEKDLDERLDVVFPTRRRTSASTATHTIDLEETDGADLPDREDEGATS